MDKPILASELITALGDAKKNILGWHGGKYAEGMRRNVFQDALYEGRAEYAECLLEQINEWEKS